MAKYVMVECLSQFLQRYMIEVPEDSSVSPIEYAEDTVTMQEMKEFSQKYLGEVIIGSRELTYDEVIQFCDKDNDYAKNWDKEQKLYSFVTEVGYKPK